MKSYIVFRVDGHSNIGLGHVMRCLTLADEFYKLNYNILFLLSLKSEVIAEKIKGLDYKVSMISNPKNEYTDDARETCNVISRLHVSLLVVDNYHLDEKWETLVSKYSEKILVIDDLANRKHDCQFLLDCSYGRLTSDYAGLCNSDSQLLMSTKYSLLRSEFAILRSEAIVKRNVTKKIRSILINFGGTDHKELSMFSIQALYDNNYQNEIHVMISSACEYLNELKYYCDDNESIFLHVDVKNVAELMLKVDLAIGSIGTSSWERCCLGLPTIGVIVADNQRFIANKLAALSVITLASSESLSSSIKEILVDVDLKKWKGLANKSFEICDGLGKERVIRAILPSLKGVLLKPMLKEDREILYSWQCELNNRQYSRNSSIPTQVEHDVWFAKSLLTTSRRMWTIIFDGKKCGYVRLDDLGETEEVSVLVARDFRKAGLAYAAIDKLKELSLYAVIDAVVSPNNIASCILFEKLGFKKLNDNRYQWIEN